MFKYKKTGIARPRSYRNSCSLFPSKTKRIKIPTRKTIVKSWLYWREKYKTKD